MEIVFKNGIKADKLIKIMNNLSLTEKIKRFPVICYARCCGWISPTANFNKGLKAQFKDRKTYKIK